jgi:hypothetical protein
MTDRINAYNIESRHPKDDSEQFWLKLSRWFLKVIPLTLRGLTTLAKERRLDFSLRGQEGEVKA